jgi:hypothetical protein
MTDDGKHPARTALERQLALHLQQAEAIKRNLEDLAELERLAAKLNIGLALPGDKPRDGASGTFDGTVAGLIETYMADPKSSHSRLKYHTRVRQEQTLRKITAMYGHISLTDMNKGTLDAWYREWRGKDNKVSVSHSFMAQLKVLFVYGTTAFEHPECIRLSGIARAMRFEIPKAKTHTEKLTEKHANDIRAQAHKHGYPSIALAQAFQFELGLLQKDVIGEWVPHTEDGTSGIVSGKKKWLRGLEWKDIDENSVLTKTVFGQGRSKPRFIRVDLKKRPMIWQELTRLTASKPKKSGAVIVCEYSHIPWVPGEFRRKWRIIARAANIPDHINNKDVPSSTDVTVVEGVKEVNAK